MRHSSCLRHREKALREVARVPRKPWCGDTTLMASVRFMASSQGSGKIRDFLSMTTAMPPRFRRTPYPYSRPHLRGLSEQMEYRSETGPGAPHWLRSCFSSLGSLRGRNSRVKVGRSSTFIFVVCPGRWSIVNPAARCRILRCATGNSAAIRDRTQRKT